MVWYMVFVGEEPNFLFAWFPAALLVAIGIAMTFPLVSAAAVVDVPPGQFAVAGGVNNVGRQLGATIGVSVLVSIVGEGVRLSSFRQAWLVVALAGPIAAGCLLLLPAESGKRRADAVSPAPTLPAPEVDPRSRPQ
jgi:hypothetical protein